MRKRGRIFSDYRKAEEKKDVVAALKLVLEVLCDIRVNTYDDPNPDQERPVRKPRDDK